MMWDEVLTDVRGVLLDDADVLAVLGYDPVIAYAQERQYKVPCIEFDVVSDVEAEVFNPIRVQWDLFAPDVEQGRTLERAVRRILHHDLPVTFGRFTLWSQIIDSRPLPGPEDGVFSRSLDQQLTPVRSKYNRST